MNTYLWQLLPNSRDRPCLDNITRGDGHPRCSSQAIYKYQNNPMNTDLLLLQMAVVHVCVHVCAHACVCLGMCLQKYARLDGSHMVRLPRLIRHRTILHMCRNGWVWVAVMANCPGSMWRADINWSMWRADINGETPLCIQAIDPTRRPHDN